ncbi:FkbM family methyltransferase [Planctomycetota bacterium]
MPSWVMRKLKNKIFGKHLNEAYSQEGEDLILKRVLASKGRRGFFVDIGAHHPQRFSNTYIFYKKGWRGINVDAMPGSMEAFNELRPEDTNLEMGVSKQQAELTFYIFNDPALNGFSEVQARKIHDDPGNKFEIVREAKVSTMPLADLLDKHLPEGTAIDFMNVDVEGLDMEVLQSNNWDKYKPGIVAVESGCLTLDGLADDEVANYLSGKGYTPFAKTFKTVLYADAEFKEKLCQGG